MKVYGINAKIIIISWPLYNAEEPIKFTASTIPMLSSVSRDAALYCLNTPEQPPQLFTATTMIPQVGHTRVYYLFIICIDNNICKPKYNHYIMWATGHG